LEFGSFVGEAAVAAQRIEAANDPGRWVLSIKVHHDVGRDLGVRTVTPDDAHAARTGHVPGIHVESQRSTNR
jgi:hypothetical protein